MRDKIWRNAPGGSISNKKGGRTLLKHVYFSCLLYGVVHYRDNRVKRNIDIGSHIEDPASAAAPSAASVGAIGAQCASRGGPDLGDQTDKVIGYSQYYAGKSEARLAAAFCIDRYGLANVIAKAVIEVVIHRFAETPFQKVVFKPAICSIAI